MYQNSVHDTTIFASTYLTKQLFGCKKPFSTRRNWIQRSLKEWMTEPLTDARDLRELSVLAAVVAGGAAPAKKADEDYKKLKTKAVAGFQFCHDAAAAKYSEAAEKGALTGIYFADIDHIRPSQVADVVEALLASPACVGVGVSVSKRGVGAAFCYSVGDDASVSPGYIKRVEAAVFGEADRALAAQALPYRHDDKAANGVRWRLDLQNARLKSDNAPVTPLEIPPSIFTAKPKKETASPDAKLPEQAQKAVAEVAEMGDVDGQTADRRVQAAIFKCRDCDVSQAQAAASVRAALAHARPESSRLKNGGVESLCAWVYDKPQKDGNSKRGERAAAAAFFDGYTYDTFTDTMCNPAGERVALDTAAAECARLCGVSLNMATEAANVWVRNNPGVQFDGLTRRVLALAAAFTDADRGAIDRYCERMKFDAYEARRVHLWMYQVCGRALKRGEKTDGMLVLTGGEGYRKTAFFDAISLAISGEKAAPYNPAGDKDSDLTLAQRPVVVIDEIDKIIRKLDVAEIKTRITATSSFIRAPYDKGAKMRLNAAVFGATTNDPKPIPAGEREARRYWVVRVTEKVFISAQEAASMMREAAHTTKAALDKVGDAYQLDLPAGKVWVATDEEETETAQRNGALKNEDAAAIGIATACAALDTWKNADVAYPARAWAVAIERGTSAALGGVPTIEWDVPQCRAADVARLLSARLSRTYQRTATGTRAGYTLTQIRSEFAKNED